MVKSMLTSLGGNARERDGGPVSPSGTKFIKIKMQCTYFTICHLQGYERSASVVLLEELWALLPGAVPLVASAPKLLAVVAVGG